MVELSLRCPQDRVEDVSDALQALDAQSVSVEDADALTDAEQALFGEPGMVPTTIGWRHSTIKALFADDAAARDAADAEHAHVGVVIETGNLQLQGTVRIDFRRRDVLDDGLEERRHVT